MPGHRRPRLSAAAAATLGALSAAAYVSLSFRLMAERVRCPLRADAVSPIACVSFLAMVLSAPSSTRRALHEAHIRSHLPLRGGRFAWYYVGASGENDTERHSLAPPAALADAAAAAAPSLDAAGRALACADSSRSRSTSSRARTGWRGSPTTR
jgi:hypothetical protein